MYHVGSLVRLNVPCLGNDVGTVGVCYEVYDLGGRKGYSFIFENGNYDGFSPDECDKLLTEIGSYPLIYQFENVSRLWLDWDLGKFDLVFELAKSM